MRRPKKLTLFSLTFNAAKRGGDAAGAGIGTSETHDRFVKWGGDSRKTLGQVVGQWIDRVGVEPRSPGNDATHVRETRLRVPPVKRLGCTNSGARYGAAIGDD
jgi:hypothetical protein